MTDKVHRQALAKVDFYADDWLVGTLELTPEQRGVYITLCALYWSKQGRVPEHDRWLAGCNNMSTRRWRSVKKALVEARKIEFIDGYLYQVRAEIVLENALKVKATAKIKGRSGGIKSAELRSKMLKRNKPRSTPGPTTASTTAQAGLQARARVPPPLSTDIPRRISGDEAVVVSPPGPQPSLKKQIFGPCLTWLAGEYPMANKDSLRILVGKWIRDYGNGATLEAMVAAERNSPVDPKTFILKILKRKKANGAAPPRTEADDRAALARGLGLDTPAEHADIPSGTVEIESDPVDESEQ